MLFRFLFLPPATRHLGQVAELPNAHVNIVDDEGERVRRVYGVCHESEVAHRQRYEGGLPRGEIGIDSVTE